MKNVKPPVIIVWPTTTHVVDRETGRTFRFWKGKGKNGTEIGLLVRAIGMSDETDDLDGIGEWFNGPGSEVGEIVDAGDLPAPDVVVKQPDDNVQ